MCPYVGSADPTSLFTCPFLNKLLTDSSNFNDQLLRSTKGNFQITLIKLTAWLLHSFDNMSFYLKYTARQHFMGSRQSVC